MHELGTLAVFIMVSVVFYGLMLLWGQPCLLAAQGTFHRGAARGADRQETAQSEGGMCVCSSGTDP